MGGTWGLTRISTSATLKLAFPAWISVSMQYEKRVCTNNLRQVSLEKARNPEAASLTSVRDIDRKAQLPILCRVFFVRENSG